MSSEDYSLVAIAVMFHLVAQVVETAENSQDNKTLEAAKSAAECGRKLLLDLLAYVVRDCCFVSHVQVLEGQPVSPFLDY